MKRLYTFRLKTPAKAAYILCLSMTLIACKEKINPDTSDFLPKQKTTGNFSAELPSNAILIIHDKNNHYWFANEEDGLFKYDGKTLLNYTTHDGLESHTIIGVQQDKEGNLFFDTPEGISKFDGNSFTTLQVTADQNKSKPNREDLWFRMGWDSGVAYRYDGKHLYELKLPKSPIENEFRYKYPNVPYNPYGIYSIYKSNNGDVWLGTSSMGLYRFDGKKISWMYEDEVSNIPNGGSFGYRSITEDLDGHFWINTSNHKYTIETETKKSDDIDFIHYTKEPGLENLMDHTLYNLAMVTDKNGAVWMATFDEGVWKYNGVEVTHFPIKNNDSNLMLAATNTFIIDNKGVLWVATQNDGAYTFTGEGFEKFYID